MASMNISLPEETKAWVEAETENGHFASASDYFRDLVRRDQARKAAIARLQEQIDIGLKSGTSSKSFDEIIDEARRQASERGLLRD